MGYGRTGQTARHDERRKMDGFSYLFLLLPRLFYRSFLSLSPRGLLQEKRKTYINVWFKVQTPVHCTYILN